MKSLLLDTTFVLPLFGIEVQLKNQKLLKKIWTEGVKGYSLKLSSISLIEVMYKLNREYRITGDLDAISRYNLILPTILNSPTVKLIHSHTDPLINQYFMRIREAGHSDLMDCWIFSTAIAHDAIFLSEDITLKKIAAKNEGIQSIQFWNWDKFTKEIGYEAKTE